MKEEKFPGWLKYVVLCNDVPVASFSTKKAADTFGERRAAAFKQNTYRLEINE